MIKRFCELIHELIAETSSIHLELENVHVNSNARSPIIESNNVQDILSEMKSETDYSYFSGSHYSVQSRASMRSSRHLRNKPRPSNFNETPVSNYRKPPCLSPDFGTVQQADVEAASELRDFAFAATDQTAQHQKLLLENELEMKTL